MTDRTFGIKVRPGLEGPLICFGQIRRDPLTMKLVMDELEGADGARGLVVSDSQLLEALERLMVVTPLRANTNECGPMFWSFKKAVDDAVRQIC